MTLTTYIANPKEYTTLASATSSWSKWAADRSRSIEKSQKKDVVGQTDWLPVLQGTVGVCMSTSHFLQQAAEPDDLDDFGSFPDDKDFDHVHVCKDDDDIGKIQGIALTKILQDKKLEIVRLMTRPHNIPSSYPKNDAGITGVGTELITHLQQLCLKDHVYTGLIAEPIGQALPFYVKKEFVNVGDANNPMMLLTTEQIRKLYEKAG